MQLKNGYTNSLRIICSACSLQKGRGWWWQQELVGNSLRGIPWCLSVMWVLQKACFFSCINPFDSVWSRIHPSKNTKIWWWIDNYYYIKANKLILWVSIILCNWEWPSKVGRNRLTETEKCGKVCGEMADEVRGWLVVRFQNFANFLLPRGFFLWLFQAALPQMSNLMSMIASWWEHERDTPCTTLRQHPYAPLPPPRQSQ